MHGTYTARDCQKVVHKVADLSGIVPIPNPSTTDHCDEDTKDYEKIQVMVLLDCSQTMFWNNDKV